MCLEQVQVVGEDLRKEKVIITAENELQSYSSIIYKHRQKHGVTHFFVLKLTYSVTHNYVCLILSSL